MPTDQEIFNTVAAHLIKQSKQAVDKDGDCVYRAPDGCKCAVGILIPDDKYDPQMEGKISRDLLVKFSELKVDIGRNSDLLCDLQSVHDDSLILYPKEKGPGNYIKVKNRELTFVA